MPCRDPALQEEEDQRNEHDDHAQSRRKVGVVRHLAHELVIKHHRISPVAFTDEHRGTEIGEDPHEHQQGGGQHRRQHQRQDDPSDPLEVIGAERFRGFIQGVVQVFQCAGDIHINQREGLE